MIGIKTTLRLALAASAIACGLAATSPAAHAGLLLEYKVDGAGPFITLASGASNSFQTYGPIITIGGDFSLAGNASSNSPGTPTLAKLLSSTLSIANLTGATHTLELRIGATDFVSPSAPPNILVNSHIGGSVVVGSAANLMSFASCIDIANGQNVCPGAFNAGPGTPSITSGSFQNDQLAIIDTLGGSYSIAQDMFVTLGANSEINTAANTTLVPAPEPASMTLVAAGMLVLSMVRRRRRS